MPYKVTINTDAYKHLPCSKKNWEPGTLNDYMVAINGWHTTERSLKQLRWRVDFFSGNAWQSSEWEEEKGALSVEFATWLNKRCNTVKFHDRLCGFERTERVQAYGWALGYAPFSKYVGELKRNGSVRIPFSDFYDTRQRNHKLMKGCYIEICKTA